MAKIPQYILKLLERRTALAESLIEVNGKIDKYCERIGLEACQDNACLCSDFRIYCEPFTAQELTSAAIQAQLNKNQKAR